MSDIQEKILELMDLFDDDEVTTADKINRPEPKQSVKEIELFNEFNIRNPKAGGGMLVQPSADGSRPGYAKPVGTKKGKFTTKAMDNISDAILKAYADDDIQILFEKGKNNPQGLLTPQDSKAGIFQKIKTDQDRLNTVVKNTGLDQETILNILDDRDAFLELEKTTVSQETRFKDRAKFFKKAEKWLTTNAKRYADPVKFEKAFARTFGKNNLITKTIKANITEARGKGRLSGFSDDFINTIMSVREGTTKADNAFNSIQLKDMFKTVIYNNNPNVRKRITTIFENIIPKPGSRRTPDIRNLFANDPVLKKFGLNKSIKGPIARLIANEINEELLTNVKNFQKPFLGTDALLSFLKDRVDPKYKKMFGEASNAVKQAQKNQWPQAKKTLNLAQDINFDHKIPKSIIDLGYADEIEYIKLNPTSQKFNQTIKRSQFDTPMNELIRKFEQTKTLDGKAAVVKKMNTLKNKFSKKYGGYLDEVTIIPDKTGKPIFKSSAAPVTKKTDFVSSLGKSLTQTGEINKKQLDNLLLKLSAQIDSDCAGAIKQASKDGGRIGLQAIGSRDVCITKAKNYARDQVAKGIPDTGVKGSLIKRIFKSTSDFVKSALDPKELFDIKKQFFSKGAIASLPIFDAAIAGYEALAMNKPVKEAVSNTLTFGSIPRAMGIGIDTPEVLQAKQLLQNPKLSPAGKEYAQLIIDQGEYEKLQSNVTGGVTEKFKNFKNLQNKIKNASTAGRFDYQSLLDEIQATQLAKDNYSPLIGSLGDPLKNRAVAPRTGTRQGPGPVKIDLSPITYQNFKPDIASKEDLENYFRAEGYISEDEQLTPEFYQQEFVKPAEFEQLMELPSFRGASEKFAGGGIAKIAGVDQGPPPESGPNSQGLKGLFNRAKNI